MKIYRMVWLEPQEKLIEESQLDNERALFSQAQLNYRQKHGKPDSYPVPIFNSIEKIEVDFD